MIQDQTLIAELQSVFEQWRKENKKRSFATLSRMSKQDYQDVRRTIQGEIKTSFTNVMPLIEVMLSPTAALKFYEKHFSTQAAHMKKVFKRGLENNTETSKIFGETFQAALNDPIAFQIIAMLSAAQETPVKRSFLISEMGEQGAAILDYLISEDIVKEISSNEVALSAYDVIQNDRIIANLITQNVQLLTRINRSTNCIYFNKVNQQSLEQAYTLIKETEVKLAEIFSQSDAAGSIPISYSMSLGRIGQEF
ncbi:MAG: hypothetical protein KBD78_09010 [Oligoflexales bacterium]|nr:hypothetical protein [Oligoflexales bacterium]